MLNFVWGGNTGISSPEELAQRRLMAKSMIRSGTEKTPQDPWEGLASLARAVSGNYADYAIGKEEAKNRQASDDRFAKLFPDLSGGDTATVTPAGYAPPSLDSVRKGFLDTIAGPESGGKYDVMYGGGKFTNFADHPRQAVPIASGPNAGKTSSAAGKYQMLGSTWDQQKNKLKLPDFSPESQDAAAWDLAASTYHGKTGRMLADDLTKGDDTTLRQIAQIMSPVWTSMPGGIEQGTTGDKFVAAYKGNLGRGLNVQPAGDTQVTQAGGSPDLPSLMQAYSDPWMSENQRDVLKIYMQKALEAADPKTKLELRKMGLEVDALENPQPKYDYQKMDDGTLVQTSESGGPVQQVYKGAPKPTDDIAEYNFYVKQATAAGQTPLPFDQYQQSMKKAGATSINMNTGEPGDSKLRGKLQEKEAESWSNYQTGAASASGLTQQIEVLDELGKMAPQGGIQGRLAQAFPGFSTAGDAFMSIATRIAPSFREPGSGSTSDIEYQGFLNGLPRLQTSPGGNLIISQTIRNMAQIKMERGLIVDRYSNGEITAPEARRQMAELNKRSIMTPELQAVINANTKGGSKPGEPDADGWITQPDGTQVREMK